MNREKHLLERPLTGAMRPDRQTSGPEGIRGCRRLSGAAQGPDHDAKRSPGRSEEIEPARPGRRRISDRPQMGNHGACRRPAQTAISHRQCGRDGARHLQGPHIARGQPSSAHRRDNYQLPMQSRRTSPIFFCAGNTMSQSISFRRQSWKRREKVTSGKTF